MNLYQTVSVKQNFYLALKEFLERSLKTLLKVLLVNLKIYILPLIKKKFVI